MEEFYKRTAMLIGEEGAERLKKSRVAVFGLGGVGGIAAEALARSGVGHLTLIDCDEVSPSNLNRQIIATKESLGKQKTEAAALRILAASPTVKLETKNIFFLPDGEERIDFSELDFIIDAVDTVTAKIEIVMQAREAGVPMVSVMGTGNKLDPTKVRLGELFETSYCPLCKVMRRELKKRGVNSLNVVYSSEQPITPCSLEFTKSGKAIPGSMMFVPAAAGLTAAYFAVKALIKA